MATKYMVGLDLGRVRDYTAIAVLEKTELMGDWDPVMYARRKSTILRVRHLERVAIGTPYTEQVQRVRKVVRSGDLAGQCRLVADATGVGGPVIEMLREAELGCTLYPVMITGGHSPSSDGSYWCVPKRDLIVGVQVALQRGALQIPRSLDASGTLMDEMSSMQVRVSPYANEQFGCWREGEHDDLVLAVALACWGARMVWGPTGNAGYWQWG
jgi:hypothetical protein